MQNLKNKIETFTFRCSALGNIVTKSGKLTDGAKTYIEEVYIGLKWGVQKEAYGKPLEKGKACEEDGFAIINLFYPGRLVKKEKDEDRMSNDFINGLADTIMDDIIFDIKNAYTRFTFAKATLSHLYEWQLKGYCYLYGKTKGCLFYCLNNMPEYMIAEEQRLMFYKSRKYVSFEDEEYIKACEELRLAHIYDSIPLYERFKLWDVEYTDKDRERIEDAVIQARLYMMDLYVEDMKSIEKNLKLLGYIDSAHSHLVVEVS